MPDHETTMNTLTSLIKERVSPHVSVVCSKDCSSMKGFMAKVIGQLVQKSNDVSFFLSALNTLSTNYMF